jgi:hypothetical protein
MLPRERVIAAIDFQTPDRIPGGELAIDYPITEEAVGHTTLYRAKWREYQALWQGRRDEYVESCKRDIVAVALELGHDIVPVFLVPPRRLRAFEEPGGEYAPNPLLLSTGVGGVLAPSGIQPEFISDHRWRMPDGRVYVYSPETQGNPFMVEGPRPSTPDQVKPYEVEIDDSQLELVHHVVRELGDTHFIVGRPPDDGIFPHDRYEMDFMLMSMVDRPEVVERIIEVESTYNIELAKIMLDAGCDAVVTHNDISGSQGPLMSPAMIRRYCLPWLKAWADMAHDRGKYFFKHTDGNTWKVLDLLVEAGVDAWHGIQPAIGMNLPELQERYGGKLCFWGGVDLETLIAGSEADVREQVRIAVESAPRDGGLILGAGNSLMVGVQYRNVQAMNQAAKSFHRRQSVRRTNPGETALRQDLSKGEKAR